MGMVDIFFVWDFMGVSQSAAKHTTVMKRIVINIILLKNNLQEMYLVYNFDERNLFTTGDKKTD